MASQFRTARKWITKRVAPDYTNQLDLFSEAVPETPTPVVPAPRRAFGTGKARLRPQQLGFEIWEPLAPFDAADPAARNKPVTAAAGADQDVDRPEPQQPHAAAAGADVRNERPRSVEKVLDIEPAETPSRDFRITGAHRIGQGTLQEKARDNIAAIRLLKALETEDRNATDDEKAILSLYVGWGAMPNVFAHHQPAEWRSTSSTLKEMLTGPEFESARASTPNAHYTSPMVIGAIWSALHRIGLRRGARILEPAMEFRVLLRT